MPPARSSTAQITIQLAPIPTSCLLSLTTARAEPDNPRTLAAVLDERNQRA
jgi:hypothetical protein